MDKVYQKDELKIRVCNEKGESIKEKYLLHSEGYVSHQFNWWADILRVNTRMQGQSPTNGGEAYTIWMAGGGIKGGISYGSTDDFGYYVKENPVIVRDMHATILNALGMDHENLTYRFQGLDQRLTGTEPAKVHHQLFG